MFILYLWGGGGERGHLCWVLTPEVDQRVQTSNYKMNKFWGYNVQHGDL